MRTHRLVQWRQSSVCDQNPIIFIGLKFIVPSQCKMRSLLLQISVLNQTLNVSMDHSRRESPAPRNQRRVSLSQSWLRCNFSNVRWRQLPTLSCLAESRKFAELFIDSALQSWPRSYFQAPKLQVFAFVPKLNDNNTMPCAHTLLHTCGSQWKLA